MNTKGPFPILRLTAAALALAGLIAGLSGCHLLDKPVPPDTPAQVTATQGDHPERVELTWAPTADATFYRVERAEAEEGPYDEIGESTDEAYEDEDVTAGVTYWYRVLACNNAGCSAPSSPVQGHAAQDDGDDENGDDNGNDVPPPPPPPPAL